MKSSGFVKEPVSPLKSCAFFISSDVGYILLIIARSSPVNCLVSMATIALRMCAMDSNRLEEFIIHYEPYYTTTHFKSEERAMLILLDLRISSCSADFGASRFAAFRLSVRLAADDDAVESAQNNA